MNHKRLTRFFSINNIKYDYMGGNYNDKSVLLRARDFDKTVEYIKKINKYKSHDFFLNDKNFIVINMK